MQRCEDSCPKIRQKGGTSHGGKSMIDDPNSNSKNVTSGSQSPLQIKKSVKIGETTTVTRSKKYLENKSTFGSGSKESQSFKQSEMSARTKSSLRDVDRDWNSTGHDPCPSVCPMSKTRDLAAKKAQLRQERLDEYLLNKGFSYFDDLCTCSSICLMNQLCRDKFVLDFLKSACIFTLGVKLCEELDAWNIIG